MRAIKNKTLSASVRARDRLMEETRAVNEQLLLSGVHQHELAEAARTANLKLRAEIAERKQAEKALQQSEARLSRELTAATRLQETSTFLIQGGDPGALYKQIVETAVVLMQSDMASLQMFYPDRGELRLLVWKGFELGSAAAFWKWVRPGSRSSCGVALRTERRVIVADVETADLMAGTPELDAYRKSGIRAVQSTPLLSRSGKIVGMISTHWRKVHEPTERELRLFDVLARQAADLIERTRAEEALRHAQAQLADRAVHLEKLVAERTAKLMAAHEQLLADANERKRLEGQIVHAVEEEQLRLGEELHDGLAQELAGATMMLYALEKKLKKASPPSARKLHEINEMLMTTGNQARKMATGFYPVDLKKHGLGVALQHLARRTQKSFGIACAVKTDKNFPTRSEDPRAIHLFRIVQEAVHNAVKHSRARHICIRLSARAGASRLTVKDDGTGLHPAQKRSGGMGRNIMQYRAGLIGGNLEVRNAEEGGVIVSCVVPAPKVKGKE